MEPDVGDSDDSICICKTYDVTEAELIRMQLEAEGIICFLKSDNAGSVLSHPTMMTGTEVMVRGKDEREAKQIIDERSGKNHEC